jgi:hypothetical protein
MRHLKTRRFHLDDDQKLMPLFSHFAFNGSEKSLSTPNVEQCHCSENNIHLEKYQTSRIIPVILFLSCRSPELQLIDDGTPHVPYFPCSPNAQS